MQPYVPWTYSPPAPPSFPQVLEPLPWQQAMSPDEARVAKEEFDQAVGRFRRYVPALQQDTLWGGFPSSLVNQQVAHQGEIFVTDRNLAFVGSGILWICPMTLIVSIRPGVIQHAPPNPSSAPVVHIIGDVSSVYNSQTRVDGFHFYTSDGRLHILFGFSFSRRFLNVFDHAWRACLAAAASMRDWRTASSGNLASSQTLMTSGNLPLSGAPTAAPTLTGSGSYAAPGVPAAQMTSVQAASVAPAPVVAQQPPPSQGDFWNQEAERKAKTEKSRMEEERQRKLEKKQKKAIRKAQNTTPLAAKVNNFTDKLKWSLQKGSIVEGMHQRTMDIWVECHALVSTFPNLQMDFVLERHRGFAGLSAHEQILLGEALMEYLRQGLLEGPESLVQYMRSREHPQLTSMLVNKEIVKTILIQPSLDVKASSWILVGTRLIFSVGLLHAAREEPPLFGKWCEVALKIAPPPLPTKDSGSPPPLGPKSASLQSLPSPPATPSGGSGECSACHVVRDDVKLFRLTSRGETEPRLICRQCAATISAGSSAALTRSKTSSLVASGEGPAVSTSAIADGGLDGQAKKSPWLGAQRKSNAAPPPEEKRSSAAPLSPAVAPKTPPVAPPRRGSVGQKSAGTLLDPGAALQKPMDTWTVENVVYWVEKVLCLAPEAVQSFRQNRVDGSTLASLSEDELKTDIGITAIGDRKKILRERLQKSGTNISTSEEEMIPASSLKFMKVLGSGFFGQVHLALWHGKTKVAVKHLTAAGNHEEFMREVRILQKVKHPHVIISYGMSEDDEHGLMLVTEFMDDGSLLDFLRGRAKNPLVAESLLQICIDISSAMDHLERVGIVHRDLAARNVLVRCGKDDQVLVKLSDFGMGKVLDHYSGEYVSEVAKPLPVKWTAPEALLQKRFSSKSDAWAFGVTVWEVYSDGDEPYADVEKLVHFLRSGGRLQRPSKCPVDLWGKCIKPCFEYEPEDRPTFEWIYRELSAFASSDSGDEAAGDEVVGYGVVDEDGDEVAFDPSSSISYRSAQYSNPKFK